MYPGLNTPLSGTAGESLVVLKVGPTRTNYAILCRRLTSLLRKYSQINPSTGDATSGTVIQGGDNLWNYQMVPYGIAVDANGNAIVTVCETHRTLEIRSV